MSVEITVLHAGIAGGGAGGGGHRGGLQVLPAGHHAVHRGGLGAGPQRGPLSQAVPQGRSPHATGRVLLPAWPIHQTLRYCTTLNSTVTLQ